MKKAAITILIVTWAIGAKAQDKDIQLAQEYLQKEDYEKAKVIFQKLAKDNHTGKEIHESFLKTLFALRDYDEAEKFLKKQIKAYPTTDTYKADYALVLEMMKKNQDGEKLIKKTIDEIKSDPRRVEEFAQYLTEKNKAEFAEETYLKARDVSKNKKAYAFSLAQVYAFQGKTEQMIEEFLNLSTDKDANLEDIKNTLQENISKEEDFDKLEKALVTRIQKEPTELTYNDLLMWYYLQQKDFYKAFIQARAMDKRMKLEGSKLLEVGNMAMSNKDYKNAAVIFDYLTKEYPTGTLYPVARRSLINAREDLVKTTYPVDLLQIRSLITDYKKLISDLGKNTNSKEALRSMGVLYGFYLDKKDSAIVMLEDAVKIGTNDMNFVGKCKLDMGDIYILKNEPWESTLLYAQVEKDLKENPLGYEAKLRNARLSYYKGEFELAKSHLDVLKLATSREIANDAMDLSLLISDNILYDSTGEALKEFAKTELLLFQNKNEEALQKLQQMVTKFEKNSLIDEMLWLRANIYVKQGNAEKAIQDLDKIVNGANYYTDILRDDAYFLSAKLYEEKLNQKDKAMEMYRNYLEKFPGTIYIAEARKRFRALRGDKLN
jgi:tetratricopeptide (TPR) repeat protein